MKIAVVVIVATAILVLFILPAFDVAPTAMRSARAAALLMLALAWAASAFFSLRRRVSYHLHLACDCDARPPDLLEVTCSLLC